VHQSLQGRIEPTIFCSPDEKLSHLANQNWGKPVDSQVRTGGLDDKESVYLNIPWQPLLPFDHLRRLLIKYIW
jgi:hypothetical protein